MAQKNPTKKQLAVKNAGENGKYPSYSGSVFRFWNGQTSCTCGYDTCDGHCAVGWSIGGFILMMVITILMACNTPAVPALAYLIPLAIGVAMNGGTIAAVIGTLIERWKGYDAEFAKLEANGDHEYQQQCIVLAREEAQAKYEKGVARCEAALKKLEEKKAFNQKTRKWIEERNVAEKEKCLRSSDEELARVEQEIVRARADVDKLRLKLDSELSFALKAEADLQRRMMDNIHVDLGGDDANESSVMDKLAEIDEKITGEAVQTLRTDEDVERAAAELAAQEEDRQRRETRRTRA